MSGPSQTALDNIIWPSNQDHFFRYQIACRSRTVSQLSAPALLVSFRSLIMIQKFCAPLVSPSATNKSESDCDVVFVLHEGAQDRPVGKGHKCPPWVWSMRNWVGCENHQKYFIRIFRLAKNVQNCWFLARKFKYFLSENKLHLTIFLGNLLRKRMRACVDGRTDLGFWFLSSQKDMTWKTWFLKGCFKRRLCFVFSLLICSSMISVLPPLLYSPLAST